jgi:YebC/PmpR family DNA-binding regulatory protein
MVDVLTDNRNRTAGEVRKTFEKNGGRMGSAGNVAYLFERKGLFGVSASAVTEDALLEVALEAGAEDVKRHGDTFDVTCDPTLFAQVQAALAAKNIPTTHAEITQLAKVSMDADVETGRRVMRLIEALDDHDDVQTVYSDLNVTEAMLAEE